MAARPAGANPPALKIKLKPRKEHTPIASQQASTQPELGQTNEEDDVKAQEFDAGSAGVGKRKFASPSSSPTSGKRAVHEENSPVSEAYVPLSASGDPLEVLPGHCEGLCTAEPQVFKQWVSHPHASVTTLAERDQALQIPTSTIEEDASSNKLTPHISLENISHGQLQVISVVPVSYHDEDPFSRCAPDALIQQQVHPFPWASPATPKNLDHTVVVIPAHGSWFSWERIHKLERQALPQLFYGKSRLSSPEVYVQARNAIITKYRENPGRCLDITDLQGVNNLEEKDLVQMLGFLSQWGLVNYQAELKLDTGGYKFPTKVPVYLEDEQGELNVTPLPLAPLESLYQFEPVRTPIADPKGFDVYGKPFITAVKSLVKEAQCMSESCSTGNRCSACTVPCSQSRYSCEKQADFVLCRDCFSNGNFGIGMTTSDFTLADGLPEAVEPCDNATWTDHETLMLLEAIELFGDNWTEISEFVGTKSKAQCLSHFVGMPIEDWIYDDMEVPRAFITIGSRQPQPGICPKLRSTGCTTSTNNHPPSELDKVELKAEVKLHIEAEEQRLTGVHSDRVSRLRPDLAFSDAANPVMSLVSFLAATVSPRVAAAAAHSALLCLAEDYQAFQNAVELQAQNTTASSEPAADVSLETSKGEACVASKDKLDNQIGNDGERNEVLRRMLRNHHWPSRGLIKRAASAALGQAAMKAKMLADQEEREVQRLAAIIVDHQFKKLSTKLKQLEDINSILERECDQIDKNRQRFCAERSRILSNLIGMPNQVQSAVGTMPLGFLRPTATSTGVSPSLIMADTAHPRGLMRPMLYTVGPNGPVAVPGPSAKPPS